MSQLRPLSQRQRPLSGIEVTTRGEEASEEASESTCSGASMVSDDSHGRLGVVSTALLLVADCVGTGVLGLPAEVDLLGPLGLLFLALQIPVNAYVGGLLNAAATRVDDGTRPQQGGATANILQLTRALFGAGSGAARATAAAWYLNLFLVLGNYLVVMGYAVQALAGGLCAYQASVVATLLALGLSQLPRMRDLGQLPTLLSIATVVGVLAICVAASRASPPLPPPPPGEATGGGGAPAGGGAFSRALRVGSALSGIIFAMGSQKLLLNIRAEMREPARADAALRLALALYGAIYLAVVLLCGPSPPGLLLDAVPLGNARRLAGFLLWLHVAVSYAINSQALCSSLAASRGGGGDGGGSGGGGGEGVRGPSCGVEWLLLTTAVTALAWVVANAVPFFQDLVGLIGGTTQAISPFLFLSLPISPYLRLTLEGRCRRR